MKMPPPFADKTKGLCHVVVETPKGSRNKFAYDEDSGFFRLRKILPAGTAFPLDFGFIPRTKGEDGDPLDVLVLMEQATYPGCLLECRLIGVILAEQLDEGKTTPVRNDRILAVPEASEDYRHITTMEQLGRNRLDDLVHFFKYYRMMSGGTFNCLGTEDADAALHLVKKGTV